MKDAFSSFGNIQPLPQREPTNQQYKGDIIYEVLERLRPVVESEVKKAGESHAERLKDVQSASDALKKELKKEWGKGSGKRVKDLATRLDDAINEINTFGGAVTEQFGRLEGMVGDAKTSSLAEVEKVAGSVRRIDMDLRRAFKKITDAQKALSSKVPDNAVNKDIDALKSDVVEFRKMVTDMQDGGHELSSVVADLSGRMEAFASIYEMINNFKGDSDKLEQRIVNKLEDMRPTYVPQLERGADGSTWHDGSTDPDYGLGVNNDYYLKTDGEYFKKVDGRWVSKGTLSAGSGLPDQSGHSGKYLTTDGSDASWATLSGGGDMAAATYDAAGKSEQVLTVGDVTNLRPYIDITGGGGTYGTLGGAINGSNTVFTVSAAEYISGTLEVEWQGQGQPQDGNGFTETTPGSGTFTMDFAPTTGTKLKARYFVALS